MKKLLSIMLMLMISVSIFAKGDNRVVVYTTTPQMHCAGCENKIKNALKFVSGVKKIETSVEEQTVSVTFNDSKTSCDKLEAELKKVGYTVKKLSETVLVKKKKSDTSKPDAQSGATPQA